ncbi:hypothetical protein NG895_28165 [Aeoliella sp. ICT_H6.2]|uniref:Uncharacterized protein n=1 Tax=Aeoliella straminimaris TaxID=2954799 RepID=A0A9X2FGA9_9BACT|nr:hypothetical protein [Aeoliella straminimaris]MCO6047798.1 hypothetical protein [Aeoliella straminimaris]
MIRWSLVLFFAVAVGSTAFGQEAPRWKFTAGGELRYEVVQQTTFNVDAQQAGTFASNASQTTDVLWRIDSVDEAGTMTATQVIERIRVSITQAEGLELVYDSDEDDAPAGLSAMLMPMFDLLLDNEVTVVVTSRGEVKEVKLPEEMEGRLASIPATRPMSSLITGAGLQRVAQQIALLLPTEGEDSASRKMVIDNRVLGNLQGELTWKAAGTEGDVHKFEPTIQLSVQPNEQAEEDPYLPVKPLDEPKITEQSVTGAAEFDAAVGKLTKSKLELQLTLTGKLLNSKVQSKVKQTVEVTAK